MKLKAQKIIFIIFVASLLFDGIITEIIMVSSLLSLIVVERKKIISNIGKKNYKWINLYLAVFVALFIIQINRFDFDRADLIRLYGLTKCICAPAFIVLGCQELCKDRIVIRTIMLLLIWFYCQYFVFGLETATQIGSINGCSGAAVVVLPVVIELLNNNSNRRSSDRLLSYIFVLSSIVLVFFSESATALYILIIQVVIYAVSHVKQSEYIKRNIKRIIWVPFILLILSTIIIASGRIDLDPELFRTRVIVWRWSYDALVANDMLSIIFGTGNNMVQMMSKTMEAHNAFIEILMTYGFVGLGLFAIFLIVALKKIALSISSKKIGTFMVLLSYFLVSFLHPFFTGVFLHQTICSLSIILMIEIENNTNQLEPNKAIITTKIEKNAGESLYGNPRD